MVHLKEGMSAFGIKFEGCGERMRRRLAAGVDG